MQNAKFNPEGITYVTFFPTDKNPLTPTFLKEKVLVENPESFAQNFTAGPGLLLLEQKGKKRSFVQHFWLEPGEPVPVEEPTQETTQETSQEATQNKKETKDEIQEKNATTKRPTPKKQPV
jgi:hypothetical protein